MKVKINVDTMSKINAFVAICTKLGGDIRLTDGKSYCVNARSLLGILATADWSEVYVESDEDIYQYIQEFVVIE
jgi:hypothetical protein